MMSSLLKHMSSKKILWGEYRALQVLTYVATMDPLIFEEVHTFLKQQSEEFVQLFFVSSPIIYQNR